MFTSPSKTPPPMILTRGVWTIQFVGQSSSLIPTTPRGAIIRLTGHATRREARYHRQSAY